MEVCTGPADMVLAKAVTQLVCCRADVLAPRPEDLQTADNNSATKQPAASCCRCRRLQCRRAAAAEPAAIAAGSVPSSVQDNRWCGVVLMVLWACSAAPLLAPPSYAVSAANTYGPGAHATVACFKCSEGRTAGGLSSASGSGDGAAEDDLLAGCEMVDLAELVWSLRGAGMSPGTQTQDPSSHKTTRVVC